jgi:dynein heavy chain
MPPPPYYVNFSPELKSLIRESKYLDHMGFTIPETALNVTLQEEKYHDYVQLLNSVLRKYDTLLAQLKPVEKTLLNVKLHELEVVLKAGFYPLNWNSLHIPTFIEKCNTSILHFTSILSNVHKFALVIEEVVVSIENAKLVEESDFPSGTYIDVSEFYDIFEKNRIARLSVLRENYKSIKDQMIKV